MVQEIAIDLLVPHPENCNHMDSKTLKKLRRHIERTGEYEPLTVRPHPYEKGKFQVINGHQRLRVLRALGRPEVSCTVWGMDDNQARLYLATPNRPSGTDIQEEILFMVIEPGDGHPISPRRIRHVDHWEWYHVRGQVIEKKPIVLHKSTRGLWGGHTFGYPR